jgi:hypothetical protein
MNPYMAFSMEERKRIVAGNPSMKADIAGVAKMVGKKWREMGEAEKARYAKKGKTMKVSRRKSRKVERKEKKTRKSGLHGYMKFAKEVRPRILSEKPAMRSDVTLVAKEIGKRWRAMSDAEKKRYD